MSSSKRVLLFVGSYAEAEDPGVYVFQFTPGENTITLLDQVAGLKNPTFVNVDADNKKLYAISETKTEEGDRIGEIISYHIDPAAGKLSELNHTFTIKPSSSHIQRDHRSKYITVAGYHGGNIGLIGLGSEGELRSLSDERQHEGHGADPVRQDRPHPHSTLFSPDNRYMLAADLGLDKIYVYALNEEEHRLAYHSEVSTPPGAGPRHLAFHPNGKFLYSINEVNSSISIFAFDGASGKLTLLSSVPTLPDGFNGENTTAEIAITNDGKHLYGSNRGHDSIVHYAVNPESGALDYVEHVSTEGGHPRHFALTPDNQYLIIANRDSNNLVLMKVDPQDGKLSFTGTTAEVSKPVCVIPVLL